MSTTMGRRWVRGDWVKCPVAMWPVGAPTLSRWRSCYTVCMFWQDWYQNAYLQSDYWLSIRAYILRIRPECETCHVTYRPQVHHRNYKHQ